MIPFRQLLAVERLARAKYDAARVVCPLDVGRVARAREAWVACVRRIGRYTRYRMHLGRLTVTVMPGRCEVGHRLGRTHGDIGLGLAVVTYLWRTRRAGRKWGLKAIRGKRIRVCG